MIKRTTREHMHAMLEENSEWNVLDLGAGSDGWKRADAYADIKDYTKEYPDKHFVQTNADGLTPFKDNEFDFVVCTHLLEHTQDPLKLCKEISRIGQRGYIEVPTALFDNMTVGNTNPPPDGHTFWIFFDDVKNEIVFKPREIIMEEIFFPSSWKSILPFFRDSMVIGLYWESTIEIRREDPIYSYTAGNSDEPILMHMDRIREENQADFRVLFHARAYMQDWSCPGPVATVNLLRAVTQNALPGIRVEMPSHEEQDID
tara:strand:- start:11191 stop:11967 length:777 start_codon:yes stop_codon:yes gene_type:complete